jgi:dTDP-4-amino-4,6-dideoxygalactose transaminase
MLSQQRLSVTISDLFGSYSYKSLKEFVPPGVWQFTGSGRASLYLILKHLRLQSTTTSFRIGLPAYTCRVVLETVQRAGCEPVFYDSGVIADIVDIQKVMPKIDALLVCYNFGYLPKIDKIVQLSAQFNVPLIEDCAQALGAKYNGKLVGSFGDFAFYSFGISKNIGFCGGLIVSKVGVKFRSLKKYPLLQLSSLVLRVIVSPLFFHHRIYCFSRKFLGSQLYKKQESLLFRFPNLARKVVLTQVARYTKMLALRIKNARYCYSHLDTSSLPLIQGDPSFLYLVIESSNASRKDSKLIKKGIELGKMHTFHCFNSIFPKARKAAKEVRAIALLRPHQEVQRIVKILQEVGL